MRPIALGRINYLFMGSEGGGKAPAIAYTLIEITKLNCVDPQAWLTNTLGQVAEHKSRASTNCFPGAIRSDVKITGTVGRCRVA